MFQFRLRSLVLVVLVASIVLGIWQYKVGYERWLAKARLQAIERLLKMPDEFGDAEWPKNSDPVSIVRAVNLLHDMGHEETMLTLRDFAKRHPDRAGPILHVLVPLLYENGESFLNGRPSAFVVEDDLVIHFLINPRGGVSTFSAKGLDQLEQQGLMRNDKMIPPDDPFIVAEKIAGQLKADEQLKGDSSFQSSIDEWIKMQLYESTSQLSPVIAFSPRSTGKWHAFQSDLQARGIYWDAERQEYATKTPPRK